MIRFKILCALLFSISLYYFAIQPVITMLSVYDITELKNVIPEKPRLTISQLVLAPTSIDFEGEKIGENTKEPGEIRLIKDPYGDKVIYFTPNDITFVKDNSTLKIINILSIVSSIILLALSISIFVLFIKVINAFRKSEIFDRRIITKISWIGICLLSIGVVLPLTSYVYYLLLKDIIAVEGYRLTTPFVEWGVILFGIAVLVINEILRKATEIKEEQDLTI